jgi:GSH-dependent disulfide-bond oxidoreductase
VTLHLHYWPTPNGKKVTIFLEEAELPYEIIPCNIGRGDQFEVGFAQLNPNTRMPLLIDDAPDGGGAPISVFESGAILLYLAEKSGKFWPQNIRQKYEVTQWVIWQMANQGPKFGGYGHFKRAAPTNGDQSYALRRFSDETNRLYGVLNNRLFDRRYLAGDTYTIADIASYPWTVNWKGQDQDLEEFPYVKRWFEEISDRPAVRRGLAVGSEWSANPADLSPAEVERRNKLLYNQRARPVPTKQ